MLPSQRDAIILDLLSKQGLVTVAQVVTHCNCSVITARRDLSRLEEAGALRRTHGGAVAIASTPQARHTNGQAVLEARMALTDRVDVLLITPTDTDRTRVLVQRAHRAGIPVIAEAIPYPGATTVVAVDNYRAGLEAGRWAGAYGRQHLRQANVLDVSYAGLDNTQARSRGFADGLREAMPAARILLQVDGQGLRRTACEITRDALAVYPEINVIFGVNDDSALGALDAYRAAGLDESKLLVVPFGLEGAASLDLLEQGGPCKMAVAMFPELVGRACVDAGICAYHGCALPERITTPFAIVTPENLPRYYQRDPRGGDWRVQWPAAQQLPTASPGYTLLGECHDPRRPARLGYVLVFSSHAWYQNVRGAMQEHTRRLGIGLEVLDASQDLVQEVEELKRKIGFAAARLIRDGDTVILDAGSTTAYLAQALRGRRGITVITNSLAVLHELGQEAGITLVSSGGMARSDSGALVGPAAEATFHELRADKAFISTTGLSLSFGLSNSSFPEAAVRQTMLRAAREVTLLADHTKIGTESLVKVAPLESIHRLVTDSGVSAHDRLAFLQRGIEVLTADAEFAGQGAGPESA